MTQRRKKKRNIILDVLISSHVIEHPDQADFMNNTEELIQFIESAIFYTKYEEFKFKLLNYLNIYTDLNGLIIYGIFYKIIEYLKNSDEIFT